MATSLRGSWWTRCQENKLTASLIGSRLQQPTGYFAGVNHPVQSKVLQQKRISKETKDGPCWNRTVQFLVQSKLDERCCRHQSAAMWNNNDEGVIQYVSQVSLPECRSSSRRWGASRGHLKMVTAWTVQHYSCHHEFGDDCYMLYVQDTVTLFSNEPHSMTSFGGDT